MDPRLLKYYNRELQHLREVGGEFASEFPKIAGRLSLDSFECADPYVERLLEGFAFLAARVQLRIDVVNRPGVLATVAAAIAEANSNIENVEYQDRDAHSASLLFTIEVRNREHLSEVMKRVRRATVVLVVHRQQT